jgi:hypothetical protein
VQLKIKFSDSLLILIYLKNINFCKVCKVPDQRWSLGWECTALAG